MIDAVRDRLPDRDIRAGKQRHLLPQLLEDGFPRPLLHLQADVDLGRFDTLHVLVELGSPGAARRGRRPPGRSSSSRSSALPRRVRVGEARARDGHGADRQRAFVELRQKGSARRERCRPAPRPAATAAVTRTVRQYVKACSSQRSYARLQPARQPRLRARTRSAATVGSSHEHSTGVTVSATTSEAVSATT